MYSSPCSSLRSVAHTLGRAPCDDTSAKVGTAAALAARAVAATYSRSTLRNWSAVPAACRGTENMEAAVGPRQRNGRLRSRARRAKAGPAMSRVGMSPCHILPSYSKCGHCHCRRPPSRHRPHRSRGAQAAEDRVGAGKRLLGLCLQVVHVHHRLLQLALIISLLTLVRRRRVGGAPPHRHDAAPPWAHQQLPHHLPPCEVCRGRKRVGAQQEAGDWRRWGGCAGSPPQQSHTLVFCCSHSPTAPVPPTTTAFSFVLDMRGDRPAVFAETSCVGR